MNQERMKNGVNTCSAADDTAGKIRDLQAILAQHKPTLMDATSHFAVLVPLVEQEGELHLLYEVRAKTLRNQPGEVCFPGGHMEAGENAVDCALRETWEELGIGSEAVTVLGDLDFVTHRTNYIMYPVLAAVAAEALDSLHSNPDEVDEVFLVPLRHLIDNPPQEYTYRLQPGAPENFPYEDIGIPRDYKWKAGGETVPVYLYEGHAIWGLTGRITRHVLKLLHTGETAE